MRQTATVDDVVAALSDLSDASAAVERTALHAIGIGPNDAKVLRFLLERAPDADPVTPRLIAELLGISSAATTALIDRLAEAGWVAREPFPGDRRSIIVRATIDADAPARRLLSVRRTAVSLAASHLGASERRVVADFLGEVARTERVQLDEMFPEGAASRAR